MLSWDDFRYVKAIADTRSLAGAAEALGKLQEMLAALEGAAPGRRRMARPGQPSLAGLAGEWGALLRILQGADATPTTQATAACAEAEKRLTAVLGRWSEVKGKEVKALNEQLRKAGLPALGP